MVVPLLFRKPFAAEPLFGFLGARGIAGVEVAGDGEITRSVRSRSGWAVISLRPTDDAVELDVREGEDFDESEIAGAARRLLDLDCDPAPIAELFAGDPHLAPIVTGLPGLRVPGAIDPFELIVRAVLGQQVSVVAARTLAGRLVERFGEPVKRPVGAVTHLFPAPTMLASGPVHEIGIPRKRGDTIRELARLIAGNEIDLSGGAPLEETTDALLQVPGIGPWTVAYVSMRALGARDAFPAGDLGIRKSFESSGMPMTVKAMDEYSRRWSPWRAYAALYLWSALK